MNPALSVEGVDKSLGGRPVLRGLSLVVQEGQACVITGANGSGKSTLLSVIAGVLEPDRGEVVIHGRDVMRDRVEALAMVGYAPERPELPDALCVMEWIDLIASIKRSPLPTRARFEHYGISHVLNQRIPTLSLGQTRRMILAAAMLGSPKLLVLDEPSNGLDDAAFGWLIDLVRGHTRSGGSALIATHDDAFAEAVADTALRLCEGVARA